MNLVWCLHTLTDLVVIGRFAPGLLCRLSAQSWGSTQEHTHAAEHLTTLPHPLQILSQIPRTEGTFRSGTSNLWHAARQGKPPGGPGQFVYLLLPHVRPIAAPTGRGSPLQASGGCRKRRGLREPRPSLERRPVEWWKVSAQRFPKLGKLAKSYLCIPGSSVPAEHVFSNAGLPVNRLRTRLTPEHVNMCMFPHKNQQQS
ncbi:unnamed protein product [Natator depressus]